MNTTQGTAGLIERLKAEIQKADDTVDCLRPLHDTEISLSWQELVKENDVFKDLLREAIAALSAKPAPVAEPVAHVIEERSTQYISAEDAMQSGLGYSAGSFPVVNLSIAMLPGKRTPPTGTTFYLRPPAPELAVADEGMFESALKDAIEMLEEHSSAHKDKRCAEYNECDKSPCMWCEKVDAAIPVLRRFKQSRSPVQEGMVMVSRDDLQTIVDCTLASELSEWRRKSLKQLQSALSTPGTGGSNG